MEASYLKAILIAFTHEPRLAWFTFAVLMLLVWKLYRFTISPIIYPDEPKEYPYWVPVIGHLRSFFQNSSRLLTSSRLYFNDRREIYALTVAGQKWYILTDPDDVAATYKINNRSLSYDIFTMEVMRMIGVSKEGISKAFQTEHAEKQGSQYPIYKSLMALSKELHLTQLSPGHKLERLVIPAIEFLARNMDVRSIARRGRDSYATVNTVDTVIVSLYNWIGDFFISFGQEAYFGKTLQSIESDMVKIYMQFDPVAWQVLYQYPSFLCGQMLEAKAKMQTAMEEYVSLPTNARSDMSWLMSSVEKEMRRLNMSTRDMAIIFFQLYWSINSNTRKTPFWMLSYMLYDPSLLARVRAETAPAFSGGDRIDLNHLLTSCPTLNSIWDETLRVTAFAASVRFLTEDLELGGKTLRKGNRIMMPQRQLHYNARVFGPSAAEFDAERFVNKPGLRRHPSLRPFGGGTTLCPGRHLVKQTTLAFVALVVQRFDIELDPPGQEFPRPEEGNPTLGLVDLKEGCDLKVRLRPVGGIDDSSGDFK